MKKREELANIKPLAPQNGIMKFYDFGLSYVEL